MALSKHSNPVLTAIFIIDNVGFPRRRVGCPPLDPFPSPDTPPLLCFKASPLAPMRLWEWEWEWQFNFAYFE